MLTLTPPRPLDALEQTPCTEKSDPALLPVTGLGTPYGIGFGGSHCIDGKSYITAGPELPAYETTGVTRAGIATDLFDCDDAAVAALTQTPSTLSCTQETQK